MPTPAGPLEVEVRPEALVVRSALPFVHAGLHHQPGTHDLPRGGPR